jgi:hypothetical protein
MYIATLVTKEPTYCIDIVEGGTPTKDAGHANIPFKPDKIKSSLFSGTKTFFFCSGGNASCSTCSAPPPPAEVGSLPGPFSNKLFILESDG